MKKGSKRKNKKNRGLFIVVLAVLVVGIGFAALQKYLTIDGTASINSNFDVRFSFIETSAITGGAYNKSEPSFTNTTATFDAAFLAPGDSITYAVTLNNNGTMNAKLENVDVNIDNSENISYELTGIQAGDIIESSAYSELGPGDSPGDEKTSKVVYLKLTYTGVASEMTTSNVKVTMKFVQTNEQTSAQTTAISLIENEKPEVTYNVLGLTNDTDESGVRTAKIGIDWNSENKEQLSNYFLGVEVYKEYYGNDWKLVKNATDDEFDLALLGESTYKIRNTYSISGVKYYSQYSDEVTINLQNQDGFVYANYNNILATDDLYFTDGIMTLPAGRHFTKMTSKNITKVIIPENYNLSDLGEFSLPTSKYYGTQLNTIVNKTGNSINWAPILGIYGTTTCEFATGTCLNVNIVAE